MTIRGNRMLHTSLKTAPSVYDEDKKKSNGVIQINSIKYYFNSNRELKKLLRMKKQRLMVA
jgi:hypothetical protein